MARIFADHPDSPERVKNTQTEIEQHLANVPRQANSGYGTARRRYAGASSGGPATALASSNGDFAQMKAALNGYRRGGYQNYGNNRYGRNNGNNGRNTQYDPNDNAPIQNNRPVLRRRP